MDKSEFETFAGTMRRTLEIYGSDLSAGAIETWWRMLGAYPLEAVQQALTDHLASSVYPPKPADVIQRLQTMDGRPDADEAWNIALQAMDENATVVWNDDIAQAKSASDPIFAEGDKVGARMAFRKAYERMVADARKQGTPVKWWITAGHDKQERIEKTQQALLEGRINERQALPHLTEGGELAPQIAAPVRQMIADMRENAEEKDHAT